MCMDREKDAKRQVKLSLCDTDAMIVGTLCDGSMQCGVVTLLLPRPA
jgi:hypothetical protein